MTFIKIKKRACLLTLLGLIGCSPEASDWTPAQSPKKNKVERIFYTYGVSTGDGGLTERDKKKLNQFLEERISSPLSVQITLQVKGAVSEKNIKSVKRELMIYGIPGDLISIDYGDAEKTKKPFTPHIDLFIERYLVIPPSCADFSQLTGQGKQGIASSNHGCSVEANLGMMVADPRDLIQGRDHSPYEAKTLAAGISRYREGNTTPLATVDTRQSSSQASSSTGSSSSGSSAGAAGGVQ